MARRCAVFALVALIPAFAASAPARSGTAPGPEPTTTGPTRYFVVSAERGPNWMPRTEAGILEARRELIEDLKAVFVDGQITLAGEGGDGDGAGFIAVIRTGDEAGLHRTLQEAGNVANGVFRLQVRPWCAPSLNWPEPGAAGSGC